MGHHGSNSTCEGWVHMQSHPLAGTISLPFVAHPLAALAHIGFEVESGSSSVSKKLSIRRNCPRSSPSDKEMWEPLFTPSSIAAAYSSANFLLISELLPGMLGVLFSCSRMMLV